MTETVQFKYKCECSIDQDNLDAGYKCMNDASWEGRNGVMFCDQCKVLLANEPRRITMPQRGFGKQYQDEVIADICKSIIQKTPEN